MLLESSAEEENQKKAPVEMFGTVEDRKQNFSRLLQEIEEERKREGVSEEEFEARLERARSFVEQMPLFHTTSLESVIEAVRSNEILSLFELEKRGRAKKSKREEHTYEKDRMLGLDRFVFATNQFGSFPLQEAVLRINNDVLNRPDAVVTAEDIGEIPDRLFKKTGLTFKIWTSSEVLSPERLSRVLEEYKRQAMSGRDFKEFFPRLIATYYEDPKEHLEYLRYVLRGKTLVSDLWRHCEPYQRSDHYPPLCIKRWFGPEIKVPGRIGLKEDPLVLVGAEWKVNRLERSGVSRDLIRVGDLWSPRVLYELSS